MYCPSKDEMDHYDEDNQNDDSEEIRQRRRYNRRNENQDLFKILFIRDLLGRRRRRMGLFSKRVTF